MAFWAFLSPAAAAEPDRYTSATIVSERPSVSANDELQIATVIDLYPHWHVYWKNPGDSGIPVAITWTLPEGFSIGDINWPTPDKITYDILANYGYYDRVALLQTLKVPSALPEGKITLQAKIDMLVCNEICIPESSTIDLVLNDPAQTAESVTGIFTAARERLPQPLSGTFLYAEQDKNLVLSLSPEDKTSIKDSDGQALEFFPDTWGIINHVADSNITAQDGLVKLIHPRGDQPLSDKPIGGLLVIKGEKGQNKGYAISLTRNDTILTTALASASVQTADHTTDVQTGETLTLLSALLLAFMGGLILNLMPCVFPVLSMKALSLVKMKDKESALARKHGLAYTTGIVLSFLMIGGTLIALKQAGTLIGWGFQLQNPVVVGALAYMFFILGLNLIGFFEFGVSFGNIGNKLTQGQRLNNTFFTGVLATIVATPCTAPFMGAAMGFALVQPPLIAISVFIMLGLGLAAPYLFLSHVPAARKFLPRPGAWMDTFKQFLAFPMFASAIWLVWVLDQQAGSFGMLLVLIGMLSVAFCLWLARHHGKGIFKAFWCAAFALGLIVPLFSLKYLYVVSAVQSVQSYDFGESFSQEKLSALLAGDDPVFVEMTAAWCITCKVNHATSINIESTKKLFADKKIRYLIGDWTNQNDEITKYLDSFGRSGVPIYVLYRGRNKDTKERPEAEILPQVLTPAIVEEYIGKD